MPSWVLPVGLALLSVVNALLGYFLRSAHQEFKELRDKVRSLDQELYGARGVNGLKQEINDFQREVAFQGSLSHWMANQIQGIADKTGHTVRDRPKRGDAR